MRWRASAVAAFLLLFLISSSCAQLVEADGSTTVYITNTGYAYHTEDCRFLYKSKIAISLADAIEQGYTPCKVCKPPRL
ncbi:MAG TPA: hypothetical protein P5142_00310 [Spirochaetia bacterium]|nr:hypothetical protein [Spirochaetia bacterium]